MLDWQPHTSGSGNWPHKEGADYCYATAIAVTPCTDHYRHRGMFVERLHRLQIG